MVRKVFLLLLLVAFWAIIILPLSTDPTGAPGAAPLALMPGQVRPATRLPVPWENMQRAVVRVSQPAAGEPGLSAGAAAPAITGDLPSPAPAGSCADPYTVQRGDSLGKIAKTCGLTLADLLAANPNIKNPNRIYSGQQLNLTRQSERGGANPLAALADLTTASQTGFWPGAALEVQAEGLPPNMPVRVGLGLSSSGYQFLTSAAADAQGRLVITLSIPQNARSGEEAFVLLTTKSTPTQQVISEMFVIGE